MSKNVRFELDINGLRQLMKSEEMQAHLNACGSAMAGGGEYGTRTSVASYVAIANVFPNSKKAAKDNYENNTLLKMAGAIGLGMTK